MKKYLRLYFDYEYRLYSWIISFFLSVLSAFSICVFYHIRNHVNATRYYMDPELSMVQDIFSYPYYLFFLLLVPLFLLMYAYCFQEETEFSMGNGLCSLFFTANIMFSLSMEHSDLTEILLPFSKVGTGMICEICALIGFCAICFFTAHLFFLFLNWQSARLLKAKEKKRKGLFFLIAFFAIVLCWTPGFVMCYPGSMYTDTLSQIESFMGLKQIDASHPILTTLFYGNLYSLGSAWIDDSFGVFLCVIVQSVIVGAVMALVAVQVREYTKSDIAFIAVLLFYGVTPVWARASIKALKDVLHTGCFLLFMMQYMQCLKEEKRKIRSVLLLLFSAVLVAFTRIATFWLAVACIIILIIMRWKAYRIKYTICLVLFVGLFFSVEKLVYPALNIKQPREAENYSLQFQQFAYYCRRHENEITPEEKRIINRTLNYNQIVSNYTPMTSDPVKQTYHGNKDAHNAFWELYFQFMLRHPMTYVKATIMNCFEHVNPWFGADEGGVYIEIDPDFYDASFASNTVWTMNNYWNAWREYPVIRLLTSTGFFAWTLLIMTAYALFKKNKYAIFGVLPIVIFLIGLFFSHVNGSIRYGYPLIASTPLFIAFPLNVAAHTKAPRSVQAEKTAAQRKRKKMQWLYTFTDKNPESQTKGSANT